MFGVLVVVLRRLLYHRLGLQLGLMPDTVHSFFVRCAELFSSAGESLLMPRDSNG